MFRFLFVMMFYVTVARWLYAEVQLLSPTVLPTVDRILSKVQIPTHDEWDTAWLKNLIEGSEAPRILARTTQHLLNGQFDQLSLSSTDTHLSSLEAPRIRAGIRKEEWTSYDRF